MNKEVRRGRAGGYLDSWKAMQQNIRVCSVHPSSRHPIHPNSSLSPSEILLFRPTLNAIIYHDAFDFNKVCIQPSTLICPHMLIAAHKRQDARPHHVRHRYRFDQTFGFFFPIAAKLRQRDLFSCGCTEDQEA